MRKLWSSTEDDLLINIYNKTPIKKLVNYFPNRSVSSIRNRAVKLKCLRKGIRKYFYNFNFFSKPSMLNSYWAGFIAADGYIRSNKKIKQVCIGLSLKDIKHLIKFKNDCHYTGPIKEIITKNKKMPNGVIYKEYKSCNINICGASKWIKYLNNNYNIISKKSLILQPPNISKLNHKLSFIIGLIDGDGTILVSKNGRIEFSICGTKEILEWIKGIFDKLVPTTSKHLSLVRHRSDKTNNNHYTYKITGFRILKILNILNKFDVPKLKRKWDSINKCKLPIYKNKYNINKR